MLAKAVAAATALVLLSVAAAMISAAEECYRDHAGDLLCYDAAGNATRKSGDAVDGSAGTGDFIDGVFVYDNADELTDEAIVVKLR